MRVVDGILILMLMLVLSLLVIDIIQVKDKRTKCLLSPLTFGVQHLSSTNGEVTCSCSAPGMNGYLFVTKDNQTWVDLSEGSNFIPSFNISELDKIVGG